MRKVAANFQRKWKCGEICSKIKIYLFLSSIYDKTFLWGNGGGGEGVHCDVKFHYQRTLKIEGYPNPSHLN
jgi:hypothetical protein